MSRRVVITGMGIVSPVGTGIEHAWNNVVAGKSGIRKLDGEEFADMAVRFAGTPVVGNGDGEYSPDSVVDAKEQKRMDKFITYALVAADEAIRDAKLEPCDPERIGVHIGSGIGGMATIYDASIELKEIGPRRISPFFIPKAIINLAAGHVSIKYGYKGPNLSIVTACATGTHSIGESMRIIQYGDADVMVCGGTESSVERLGMAGFCAMRALSTRNDEPTRASRPWDKGRDGFVMAEGAAILVLEEYEHAKARGAKIYAEISGYGMSGDASHITAPAEGGEGGLRAMKAALKDAGLEPSAVDYINAHGTSTPLGDIGEFQAVKTLFGDSGFSISSTKSVTGHMLGAAGAAEAVFSVLAIRDQIVPPTINLDDPEEITIGFDLVPNKAKKRKVDVALSNSFGFGGTNATIILKKI
ncbi:MAG: beta-ketoacyl-ACP synthase II [Alphaproteobacteria bacterium]|nr:beta-ketoacyl-ACP synthase II [Alphaproteobacteria bacterium]